MALRLVIAGVDVSKYVTGLQHDYVYRARSVKYALDGSAWEDRLGKGKLKLTVTFSLYPEGQWEILRSAIKDLELIHILFSVGSGLTENTFFRIADNKFPTPVLVQHENGYYCSTFAMTFEQI